MPCPAKNCVGGEIITRSESGTSYAVGTATCAYCAGLGFTTPERHAAYAKLARLTNL